MENMMVRLTGIVMENFKNVKRGSLSFVNSRKAFRASILGLYGQNGSGKTALIDALELLKLALTGQSVPAKFADYITVGAGDATLHYQFAVSNAERKYQVYYEFKLCAERSQEVQNLPTSTKLNTRSRAVIKDEVLSYAYEDSTTKMRKSVMMDTSSPKVFAPVGKYVCLVGKDRNGALDLLVAKKLALGSSRSFIFSGELLSAIRKNGKQASQEYLRHTLLLENLVRYGNLELFVINTANTGIISMNMLPISFKYDCSSLGAIGNIILPLEEALPIPKEAVTMVEHVIANMNIVLAQIVPGLTISMECLGESLAAKGEREMKIQLLSLKNEEAIPLKYESEGIKKIISILQLLIVVYNHASITVAIDELDAGVFEYLLGELLRIISEKGKGQLIFTSHNLRPLETIDRGFIAFTTTNPCNRYIRMTNCKDNNNLRDFYYRDIILGEQSEEVYDFTNNAEIAFAFMEAGEYSAS